MYCTAERRRSGARAPLGACTPSRSQILSSYMSSESRHKLLCGMQAMWGKGAFGCLYSWWRSGPRAVHGAVRRGPEAQHTTNGNFTFPIHAVSSHRAVFKHASICGMAGCGVARCSIPQWHFRAFAPRAWHILSLHILFMKQICAMCLRRGPQGAELLCRRRCFFYFKYCLCSKSW